MACLSKKSVEPKNMLETVFPRPVVHKAKREKMLFAFCEPFTVEKLLGVFFVLCKQRAFLLTIPKKI